METIIFEEDNELMYCMDHGFYIGVPAGIEFIIERDRKWGTIALIAEGYGVMQNNPYGLPYNTHKSYGNGCLLVKPKHFEEYLQGKVKDRDVEYLMT